MINRVICLFLFEIFPLLAFYLFSLHILFPSSSYMVLGTILAMPNMIRSLTTKGTDAILLLFMGLLLLGSFLNLMVTINGIGGSVVVIGNFALTVYCIHHLPRLKYHAFLVFLVASIYILCSVLYLGQDPNEIFEYMGLSRNHGGLVLVIWACFYCYITYQKERKISIIVPLIGLLAAYFMVGRSSLGILLTMFLLSLVIQGSFFRATVLLSLLIFLLKYYWDDIVLFYEFSSFNEHGLESSRYAIWKSYFDNLDLASFLFGVETTNLPVIGSYGGNPHNSFINLHRRLGLLAFIAFVIISVRGFKKYFECGEYYIILLLVLIYARIFFDSDFFIGPYDFVIYTILFYPFYNME